METARSKPEGQSNRTAADVEEVAHLALQVGRLLLLNGAETEQVQDSVVRFAASFGCEAHLMVSYEALLLTILSDGHFRTKIGNRVPGMNVGMAAVEAVRDLVNEAAQGRCSLPDARAGLTAIEHQPAVYPKWMVVVALGLTAASLSRLFGGDWLTFGVTWLAGSMGTWLRLELGSRHANPVGVAFAAACVSGIIGGAGVLLGATGAPALCLVAPGMIIMPGVPLINGAQDMIRNHMTLGLGRLGFAGLITVAIALGLFVATVVTGVAIPLDAPARAVGVSEDAVFSALAAVGYALLFNVPPRMGWACALCGVASHTLRTICVQRGIDIVVGTLIGALVVGCLAQGLARWFPAPPAAFAFPGVVAMVPGAYAFRFVIGSLRIMHTAATASVVAETSALGIAVVLMIGAIAIGVAAPAMFIPAPALRR